MNPLLDDPESSPTNLFDDLPDPEGGSGSAPDPTSLDTFAVPASADGQPEAVPAHNVSRDESQGDPFSLYKETKGHIEEVDRIYNSERKAVTALPNKYLRARRMQQLEAGYQEARGEGIRRVKTYEQQVLSMPDQYLKDPAEMAAFQSAGFDGVNKYRAVAAAKTLMVDKRSADKAAVAQPKLTLAELAAEKKAMTDSLNNGTIGPDQWDDFKARDKYLNDRIAELNGAPASKEPPLHEADQLLDGIGGDTFSMRDWKSTNQIIDRNTALLAANPVAAKNPKNTLFIRGQGDVPIANIQKELADATQTRESLANAAPIIDTNKPGGDEMLQKARKSPTGGVPIRVIFSGDKNATLLHLDGKGGFVETPEMQAKAKAKEAANRAAADVEAAKVSADAQQPTLDEAKAAELAKWDEAHAEANKPEDSSNRDLNWLNTRIFEQNGILKERDAEYNRLYSMPTEKARDMYSSPAAYRKALLEAEIARNATKAEIASVGNRIAEIKNKTRQQRSVSK